MIGLKMKARCLVESAPSLGTSNIKQSRVLAADLRMSITVALIAVTIGGSKGRTHE